MPRTTKSLPTTSKAESLPQRRSTRISNRQTQNNVLDVGELPSKKRKVSRNSWTVADSQACATECNERSNVIAGNSVLSKPKIRRFSRMTASELTTREQALVLKEEECMLRIQQLDERTTLLLDRENEATTKLSQLATKEAQNALSQLEEHFTCALCYEIMAYPYTLNPGQCGHTFCAICILKWFFSRLHRVCGGWHESVDCPICRSLLIITPDRVPRSNVTFPFVPNRVATAVVESLVEKLVQSSSPPVKLEDSEAMRISEPDKSRKRKREASVTTDDNDTCSAGVDLAAWHEGGNLRSEWLKKDSDGKREMNNLVKSWSTLRSNDFLLLKQRLEV